MASWRIQIADEIHSGKSRAELFLSESAQRPVSVTPWYGSASEAEAAMRRALIKLFPDLPKSITKREDFSN